MATRSNSSKERIQSTAEAIILKQGYAGTTIDEILDKAAITKGGFSTILMVKLIWQKL